jgi:hemoglobin
MKSVATPCRPTHLGTGAGHLRRPLLALALAGCAAFAPSTWAAEAARADAAPSLYQRFGGQPGVQALAADLVQRAASDARIGAFFAKTNAQALTDSLASQFCQVLGGPCRYEGPDMKTAHQDMGVRQADFNALVELLQAAMRARGIPFATQNQLLAKLAPMHRDMIEAAQ